MEKVAENIKKLRKQHRLSQQELADRLFVSHQTISGWESGRTDPDVDSLQKLADIFGVSVEYLITGKELVKEVVVEKEVVKEVVKEVPVETKYWKERMDRWQTALIGYCPLAILLAISVIIFAVIGKTLVASGLSCFIVFLLVLILISSYYYKISNDKYKECLRKENELERVCSTGTVFKSGVERHPVGAKYIKKDLPQVNPQLYEWLSIINGKPTTRV